MSRVLVGRYELGELLGQGGMSVVYRATDLRLARPVAVKVLREQFAADPEFVERFEREARAAARLSHPNIVAVYDVGSDEGTYFMVMEYVPGEDLKAVIRRQAPLRADRIVRIGEQLAAALDYAHRSGVVHRDVKPHNLLLGPGDELKVADFGIAVALGVPSLTQSGVVLGTPQYIAPEQALGRSGTPAADIYSAGVVLFELATGRVPFQAEHLLAVARMHVDQPPPIPSSLNPALPRDLEAIILRALDKDPAARFASAADLAAALRECELLGAERTMRLTAVHPGLERDAATRRPGDAGTAARPEAGVSAPPPPSFSASQGAPRHVVSRPRQASTSAPWVLGIVAGLLLAGSLIAIPLGLSWLQGGGGRLFGPFGQPTPPPAASPTLTPRIAVAATPAPTDTPQPSPTPTPTATAPATPTPSPQPTATPSSTATRTPTSTPPPTSTPTPTRTPVRPTPTPTPAVLEVPLVRGMRFNEAREQLRNQGFEVRIREVKSPAPKGIVWDQSPEAGTRVPRGSIVTLMVSE